MFLEHFHRIRNVPFNRTHMPNHHERHSHEGKISGAAFGVGGLRAVSVTVLGPGQADGRLVIPFRAEHTRGRKTEA
jgi:hypothetical protein